MAMVKIRNPFTSQPDYNCFGCSPTNPVGLNLEFTETEDMIISEWTTRENYCGYKDILHGGIQATLLDEIASWYVFVKFKTGGVTSAMHIKYHKPVQGIGKTIKLEACLKETHHKLATISVTLKDENGALCSSGEVTYYLFPEKLSRERLGFPDPAEFYRQDS